jgi:hypothetical protein
MANALLPLGVQMPDLAGAYMQGQQGYQNQQEIGRQNALRQAMAQHGPAAMQGDQNALAQLAQYDPELGMNLMGRQQDMQLADKANARADKGLAMDEQRLEMARQEGLRAAQTHSAQMSALERQQAAEEVAKFGAAANLAWKQGPEAFTGFMKTHEQAIPEDMRGITYEDAPYAISLATGMSEGFMAQAPDLMSVPEGNSVIDKANPGAGPVFTAPGAEEKPTDDMREYDRAVIKDGFKGSLQDWLLSQKRAGAVNVTTNVGDDTPADAAFYAKIDNAEGELFSSLLQRAPGIQRNAGTIDILEQQLSNAPTGAVGAWKQFAGDMGLPVDGVSDIQAAQASINAMVPDQRPAGSGTMSDADLALFKESLPRIINQPGGNGLIIGKLRAINEYDREISNIANELVSRKITREEARKRMAAVPNPLQGYAREVSGLAKSGTIEPSSSDADLFRKYGIE